METYIKPSKTFKNADTFLTSSQSVSQSVMILSIVSVSEPWVSPIMRYWCKSPDHFTKTKRNYLSIKNIALHGPTSVHICIYQGLYHIRSSKKFTIQKAYSWTLLNAFNLHLAKYWIIHQDMPMSKKAGRNSGLACLQFL